MSEPNPPADRLTDAEMAALLEDLAGNAHTIVVDQGGPDLGKIIDQLEMFAESMIGTRRHLIAGGWSDVGAETVIAAAVGAARRD